MESLGSKPSDTEIINANSKQLEAFSKDRSKNQVVTVSFFVDINNGEFKSEIEGTDRKWSLIDVRLDKDGFSVDDSELKAQGIHSQAIQIVHRSIENLNPPS